MSDKIIIGIHGLLNKPPKAVLRAWCADAIAEGLARNATATGAAPFSFDLAYWADIRNETPLPADKDDEPYITAPGEGALRRYDPKLIDRARAILDKYGGRALDKEKDLIGLGAHVEKLLGVSFEDLADYYAKKDVRDNMRSRLRDVLQTHQGKTIFLVAHSMGTIIAYDVLRELERRPEMPQVDHFVTLGSPLGLPIVTLKIREQFGLARIPLKAKRWTNFADPGDKVALDCNLSDEFRKSGDVGVQDILVCNGYSTAKGKANNHKIYGYLRCPEFSEVVAEFLKG